MNETKTAEERKAELIQQREEIKVTPTEVKVSSDNRNCFNEIQRDTVGMPQKEEGVDGQYPTEPYALDVIRAVAEFFLPQRASK